MDDLQFSYTQQARLDWFAANAPEEPPKWFVGPQEPFPERPGFRWADWPVRLAWGRLTGNGEATVNEVFENETDESPDHPTIAEATRIEGVDRQHLVAELERRRQHENALKEWRDECQRIRERNRIARYFAWRRYYAENVKAALDEEAAENLSAADFPVGDSDEYPPRAQQG